MHVMKQPECVSLIAESPEESELLERVHAAIKKNDTGPRIAEHATLRKPTDPRSQALLDIWTF